MSKSNMYHDSITQWNVCVGCRFDCIYCEKSFKAQMKRQLHNCKQCYNFVPHFHEKRLTTNLPPTKGDEFIWACSSSDIYFAKHEWRNAIIERMRALLNLSFLLQSKAPKVFFLHDFPVNVMLGITLETNSDTNYNSISKAPWPSIRFQQFADLDVPNDKILIIEPILIFDIDIFVAWVKEIRPARIYIGYDTKNCHLKEPTLRETLALIKELKKVTTVKRKFIREAWYVKPNMKPLNKYF